MNFINRGTWEYQVGQGEVKRYKQDLCTQDDNLCRLVNRGSGKRSRPQRGFVAAGVGSRLYPMAIIRSIARRARDAISSGTSTSSVPVSRHLSSFDGVIIFM